MPDELLCRIALTLIPQLGDIHAKSLVQFFGSAHAVIHAKKKDLERREGIGITRAGLIRKFENYARCEQELQFMEKFQIQPLFFTDKEYPQRLLNCYDSPALLFYRGTADLNSAKIISIVGTRSNTEYGRYCTDQLLDHLQTERILVVSGLAFGIDTLAHRSSMKFNLQTVGVLAHGLDRIYPPQNKQLAKQMTIQGGLLTDYMSETIPDKQNFPKRNRIVAGICDALIVIESGKRGGSIITAELANGYNKDVFAVPGKTTDTKSEGCNQLIHTNKAILLNGANDLLEIMGWNEIKKVAPKKQRELFIELTQEEKTITRMLEEKPEIHVDELHIKSGLSSSAMAQALLMLEMQGMVISMPGKMYKLT